MQLKHLIGNYCPLCWIKVLTMHLTYITMSLFHYCRLWAQHLPTPSWAAPAHSICTQMTHNVNWVCTIANKHHPYKSTWPDNHWKLFKRVHCTVACCMFTNRTRQDILIQLLTATQETETNTSFGLFPRSRFVWLLWLVYRCHTLKHKTNQQHNTDTVENFSQNESRVHCPSCLVPGNGGWKSTWMPSWPMLPLLVHSGSKSQWLVSPSMYF